MLCSVDRSMLGEMDDLITRIQGGLASVIAGPEAATFNDCTTNDLLKELATMGGSTYKNRHVCC